VPTVTLWSIRRPRKDNNVTVDLRFSLAHGCAGVTDGLIRGGSAPASLHVVPGDLETEPSLAGGAGSRLLVTLALSVLAGLVGVEALLGTGLLRTAIVFDGWQVRLVFVGLWLLPYVATVVIWRSLLEDAKHRNAAHLLTLEAALLVFLPFALLGVAGWVSGVV
jgi:hypothetical protein